MTMLHELFDSEDLQDNRRSLEVKNEKLVSRNRRSEDRSRRGPTRTNGIHRRRNKKFAW